MKKYLLNIITMFLACVSFFSSTVLYSDAPPLPPMFGSSEAPSDVSSFNAPSPSPKDSKAQVTASSTSVAKAVPVVQNSSIKSTEKSTDLQTVKKNSSSGMTTSASTAPAAPAVSTPSFESSFGSNENTSSGEVSAGSNENTSSGEVSAPSFGTSVSTAPATSVVPVSSFDSSFGSNGNASATDNFQNNFSDERTAPSSGFISSAPVTSTATADGSQIQKSETTTPENFGVSKTITNEEPSAFNGTAARSSTPSTIERTSPVQQSQNTEQKVISSGVGFSSTNQEAEETDVQDDELVDTFGITTGGNWVLKRVWWEKTEDMYEKIKDVFNDVMSTRTQFVKKRNDLDRELDIFYGEMGVDQGPLQNLIHQAQDLMDKEKKEQGYLDKRERAFVAKLAGKERTLEQLKLDIKGIQELDQKIDEALDTLFQQIDTCNDYEQKAWNNFKEIARELDDKQARVLYYHTETLHKDCLKIEAYIKNPFTSYFDEIVTSAQDHMQKVAQQMNGLKKEGIDLVKEAQELEKDEVKPEKDVDDVTKKEKKIIKKTWYARIIDDIQYLWNHMVDSIKHFFNDPKKEMQVLKKDISNEYDQLKEDVKHQMYVAEEYKEHDKKIVHKVSDDKSKKHEPDNIK